jgi:hypothetical protein
MHQHIIAAVSASGTHSALSSPFMQVLVVAALIFGLWAIFSSRKPKAAK